MNVNGVPLSIAAYCRISVDDELHKENTSIENQKAIISDYISQNFPDAMVDYYEDRDRSGYTFEQREQYQIMRSKLFNKEYSVLIVKDLSRFSRRNSKGLVEIEDLRDMGIRIIAIGDSIDYPTNDDWIKIQLFFFVNEMPVTDTSKKVRNVINRRQKSGQWICSVPYGYVMTDSKAMTYKIEPSQATVVRKIFELYNDGWGYKRIANYLTDNGIPTPRMDDIARIEASGRICHYKSRPDWNLVTISEILDNDFYIGTLRQRKNTRERINGDDIKNPKEEHIVFENFHEAIIDKRVFEIAQKNRAARTRRHYNGTKKFSNAYSGVLYCGDCGHPMYPMSRRDLKEAYHCGAYAKHGLRACSSHHIRVDTLDMIVKEVLKKISETSLNTIVELERSFVEEEKENHIEIGTFENLKIIIANITAEKKALIKQRAIALIDDPENKKGNLELYDELIDEANQKLTSMTNKMTLMFGENKAIKAISSTTHGSNILDRILNKTRLQKGDIAPLIRRIDVYENYVYVKLITDLK
jgi:DNA invertase Pin-like site-specific DNA recombinase